MTKRGEDTILVVGSVALDEISTPFGHEEEIIGGAAVHFSAAASLFAPVQLVGVVGDEYPMEELDFLKARGVDLGGLERREGPSFRWGGAYHYDMNTRDTTHTELGVFAEFQPTLPDAFRSARWIFLGNIDPALQLQVLDQVDAPELVACDTMNYWIEGTQDALLDVISRIDMITLNDEEARQLSGDPNLTRAGRWIQERGPRHVVIKKGEHGAVLFSDEHIFFAPGYPLEDVVDPTGAGDAFAGGIFGHLARSGGIGPDVLRRAIVYGCALGSFACEAFGPVRMVDLTAMEVEDRVRRFRQLTRFDMPLDVVEA
ncbi:MAG: PfkB family carbohydrate kinase [Gemmatimonadota bacterium]|nr:PfkB family carbohydrate kinase [Gemmatimonadota bacterium]